MAGTNNSGAEAHAPQPSKLRIYSSIPTRDANGIQHSHWEARGNRSLEVSDIDAFATWSNAGLHQRPPIMALAAVGCNARQGSTSHGAALSCLTFSAEPDR